MPTPVGSALLRSTRTPRRHLQFAVASNQYEFVHAPTEDNVSPAEGFQHFGEVSIDSKTRVLAVELIDAGGRVLYRKELEPVR